MGDRSYNIPEDWLNRVGGHDSSGWLAAFVESPKVAVANLLWDEFYFGPLNLTDRRQIVTTWLDLLGNSESFAQTLDRELTEWVKENWGRFERPADSLASAWSCLCNIVEISAKLSEESTLPSCAYELRRHFEEHTEFLGSFSTAPAADPSGAYLAAVAEYQGDDRSLLPFWHKLCELPDGVPFYYARYAMLGLRRIRSAVPSVNGTLRTEVVRGLINIAEAFDRLANEGKLEAHVARDTFRRIARQTEAAYRDSPGWALYGARPALHLSDRAQAWLKTIPSLARAMEQEREKIGKGQHRAGPSIASGRDWTRRGREIGNRLRSGDRRYVRQAVKLLDEERRYAEATGDTDDVSRSLGNFANGVKSINPQLALRWAVEALQWDPYSHYSWNTMRTVLLVQNRVTEASQFGWVAWKRFPEDVEVHNALADVLNASRRYAEAEFIYRQVVERFPSNIRARNGLAATLGRLRKFAENEEQYRKTIDAGLANATTYVGLAQLVLAKGDHAQAKAHIERALDLDPDHTYAQKLQLKLNSQPELNIDQVDDWSQIPDVISELSTFPMIENGLETIELEPEEQVDMSNEYLRTVHDSKEQETEGYSDQQPKVNNSGYGDAGLTKEAEGLEGNAGDDDSKKPYQFKPARGVVVAALVAEAYFYRNWARTLKGGLSAERRKIALTVLRRAEKLSPLNSEVLAERAALIADEGNLASAREELIRATENTHPAVVSLQVLRARVDREIAREEKRHLSELTLEELCVIPRRLRERHPSLSPLFHYQKGLAALALQDGDHRRKVAADSLSSFRRKLNHLAEAKGEARDVSGRDTRPESSRFYKWLERHVNDRVFDGLAEGKEVTPADITVLDDHWNERRPAIDQVEDFIVSHLTLGQISAELFSR